MMVFEAWMVEQKPTARRSGDALVWSLSTLSTTSMSPRPVASAGAPSPWSARPFQQPMILPMSSAASLAASTPSSSHSEMSSASSCTVRTITL